MTPNHEEFVDRLKRLMAANGISSQKELAILVGVSAPTVWAWFHQGVPQPRTLDTICKKLSVNRSWLQYGEGQMFSTVVRETPAEEPTKNATSSHGASPITFPYEELAPLIYKLYEEFAAIISDLPSRQQAAALKSFRHIFIDPLAKPEKMLSYQLGISEQAARAIISKVKKGEIDEK